MGDVGPGVCVLWRQTRDEGARHTTVDQSGICETWWGEFTIAERSAAGPEPPTLPMRTELSQPRTSKVIDQVVRSVCDTCNRE